MNDTSREKLSATIDTIERAYEFMLAYAAQGRNSETSGGDGPNIRSFLTDLVAAAAKLPVQLDSVETGNDELRRRMADFSETVCRDCEKAQRAIHLVLAAPVVSSQLVDNLNASLHLRTLLTDLFIIDEVLPR
jgi:hypothetical protein